VETGTAVAALFEKFVVEEGTSHSEDVDGADSK